MIELHYTPEELTILLDGLNHAIVALNQVYGAAVFGCQLPRVFEEKFGKMSFEETDEYIKPRKNALINLYQYLLSFENKEE